MLAEEEPKRNPGGPEGRWTLDGGRISESTSNSLLFTTLILGRSESIIMTVRMVFSRLSSWIVVSIPIFQPSRQVGTCCRACRSSRVCCAASRSLALPAEVSRPTRAWRCGSSREEPSGNNTSSSTSIDCRRRRVWRHTSQSPSVKIKSSPTLVVWS